MSFTRFSCWLWGGKEKEPVPNEFPVNSSSEWAFGYRETSDSVKFPTKKASSSQQKVKRKWQGRKWLSREERRVDRECDVVVVQTDDGLCLSGTESDGPDWSIGWLEPHGPDFGADDEMEDGFAVLVPCYRLGCKELVDGANNQLLSAFKNLPNGFSEGKNFGDWLSSNFLKT